MTRTMDRLLRAALIVALLLVGCASGPPVPDWQSNAAEALQRAVAVYLAGDTRLGDAEFGRARSELARTGRADQVARVELTRCAVRVASLDFAPCEGFETLRGDAGAAERAYADYLAGRVAAQDVALLPAQHRRVAAVASADEALAALRAIDDPLARLIATGVLFQHARTSPAAIALAADTASAQGWRRPLLAWLEVQLALAHNAGETAEAERLQRRIRLVQGER